MTNEAAERLRECEHQHVTARQNWTDDGKGGTKRDGFVAHCDDCGWRFVAAPGSAGAAPLNVLREAFSDFDPCHECDNAEKAWAALARLASKGTDR